MLPSVSVVIPCYNARRHLPATLRSVFAQHGVTLDVVVVDDGSTDGSAELVEREFPQVRLVRQANQGVSAARNRGIEEARHDWVAFIDADDLWLPGKLQAQFERLRAQPDAQMVYTAWLNWTSDEPEPAPAWLAERAGGDGLADADPGPSGWIYPELLLDCHVWTSATMARRALLQALGGFDTTLHIGEDYDLWLRASRVTPILRVDRPYALYRLHPGNVTKRVPKANDKGEIVGRALRRWGYAGPDGRQARRADVDRGLARSWSDFAGAHLVAGDASTARRAALRAVRTDPRQLLGWTVLAKSLLRSVSGG
ncbi:MULTISPECIES: glycosyltransferase family 2 protein [Rubrivivax]|uniref:Glycosyltransferase n=1 Tax=Rubrivivax benzoatilyticus TaxID=316997 RepID=A0ABX0I0P6_9BURK|nr:MULTISPECIES: glycosyltransferase [Rubrivivax]EGJ09801.1 glycosyl transferase family polysaccharide deacetylase [Rubrivivax benzoatilyticus JA2 = ATCC BAA-35]MCD0423661.1 glycosyltransferase [Rubrivivax sp. JA1024]NHK99416.1 glycosyltransferase [Rubrivivax benzoatilyticus]NHL25290.1 glycosyltransferase [Rubrivivax benzoatilyticus]